MRSFGVIIIIMMVGGAAGVVVDVRFALPLDTDPQQQLLLSSSFTVEWIATSVNATPCALSSSHYYDAGGWCQLCTVCPPSWYTLRMCGTGGQDALCASECPAGRFVAGVYDCTRACPPGAYSPQANMSGCVPCAIGSYNAWPGATACLDCATSWITGATACRPMVREPRAPSIYSGRVRLFPTVFFATLARIRNYCCYDSSHTYALLG